MDRAFRRLDPGEIDADDVTFRVRTRHAPALHDSIARSGIRTPLLVQRPDERRGHRIVSGWGRWTAKRDGEPLPCFVLPADLGLEAAWDDLIRDNDDWGVMSIARILRALEGVPGLDPGRIVAEKLPMLGLHASHDVFRRHLRLLELPPEAQRFIEEEDLPLRRALIFLKTPAAALPALLDGARELGLTLNELSEALELLEEVAHRERTDAAKAFEEIIASLGAGRLADGKDAFRRALRERRFPELTRYRERLDALEKQIHFSVPVRIEWDARLEKPGVRLLAELSDAAAVETFEKELAENRDVLRRLCDAF